MSQLPTSNVEGACEYDDEGSKSKNALGRAEPLKIRPNCGKVPPLMFMDDRLCDQEVEKRDINEIRKDTYADEYFMSQLPTSNVEGACEYDDEGSKSR
jgi:hypothetical protein